MTFIYKLDSQKLLFKVTVQFETKQNDQNEVISD